MAFNDEYTLFDINYSKDYTTLQINGSIKNSAMYSSVIIIAANPIDRMSNYSGSGLPFPNYEIAFENTQNIHKIDRTGIFDVSFKYPNSFYMPDGINKIKPSIYFIFTDINKHDGEQFRTLLGHEFVQASGRAGRLGLDTVGNVIHLHNLFRVTDRVSYKQMMTGTPQKLTSKFKISYNLLF